MSFRGPIWSSLSSKNFRHIAQDSLTTMNLQGLMAPKPTKATQKVDQSSNANSTKTASAASEPSLKK